jgi:hypothetical protein
VVPRPSYKKIIRIFDLVAFGDIASQAGSVIISSMIYSIPQEIDMLFVKHGFDPTE